MNRAAPVALLLPVLLSGCLPNPDDPRVVDHVLSRIGYGPDAFSRNRVSELGLSAYIEEQLHPEWIPDPQLEALLEPYQTLELPVSQLRAYADGSAEVRPLDELKEAKVLRAIYSRRQLEQVLVDFWFDHFNVDAGDGIPGWTVNSYEREAIRPHVLGRFEDLLVATARHPAMLDYLDNAYSTRDWPQADGSVVKGLNQNYGRELLELHTVGVDGGYTQADVVTVSRALTGWTIDWEFTSDGAHFAAWAHDPDPKTVMGGLTLPANGGEQDGFAVLHFLANHPMTAERVSRLLVERFVNEDAPPTVVMAATRKYLETMGDLRAVLRVILLSPEFLSLENARAKAKRPLVLVASLLRALQPPQEIVRERALQDVEWLGEVLYEVKPPTGYPDRSSFWAGPGALRRRFELSADWTANASARGVVWGIEEGGPELMVNLLAWKLLAGRIGEPSLQAAVSLLKSLPPSTTTAQKIEEAAGVVISTPEFYLH